MRWTHFSGSLGCCGGDSMLSVDNEPPSTKLLLRTGHHHHLEGRGELSTKETLTLFE